MKIDENLSFHGEFLLCFHFYQVLNVDCLLLLYVSNHSFLFRLLVNGLLKVFFAFYLLKIECEKLLVISSNDNQTGIRLFNKKMYFLQQRIMILLLNLITNYYFV